MCRNVVVSSSEKGQDESLEARCGTPAGSSSPPRAAAQAAPGLITNLVSSFPNNQIK